MQINDSFKKLIPPLTPDEYAQLEANCLADGIRDPLVVWQGVLIDGHNRLAIANKHGLDYSVVEKDFEDENAVMVWMVKTQFGRRNLNNYQRSILALELEGLYKAKAKEKESERKSTCQKSDKSLEEIAPIDTKKELAKIANVSHDTIMKVKKIEATAQPEMKAAVLSGEKSINEVYTAIKKAEKLQDAHRQYTEQTKLSVSENKPIVEVCSCLEWIEKQPDCDLLLTDPPYSTDVDEIETFATWIVPALNKVKPTGRAYVFIGAYTDEVRSYLNQQTPCHIKLEQLLVWSYKNTLGNNPKDKYKLNYQFCLYFKGVDAPELNCPITNEQWAVIEMNAPDGRIGDRYHTWQKPSQLAEMIVRHSTKEHDIVYDPFTCTGTFLLAAAKLNRYAKGCDISKENLDISIERGCAYA